MCIGAGGGISHTENGLCVLTFFFGDANAVDWEILSYNLDISTYIVGFCIASYMIRIDNTISRLILLYRAALVYVMHEDIYWFWI